MSKKKKSIKFGISDGAGNRAATWICWSRIGGGKHDVYLACRALGGALKASLHQSGKWRLAYDNNFFKENVVDPEHKQRGRFIEKWLRPTEIAPGVTLAYRIVTPWSAVNTPHDEPNLKQIHWIPNANIGKATEIDIFITAPSTPVSGWPEKCSMGTKLVGAMKLDSDETVWVTYWEVDMPNLPSVNATSKYYKGKSKENLKGSNKRMLVIGSKKDGSRFFYDCVGEVKEDSN